VALIALCLWVVVAWAASLALSAPRTWPAAYALMVAGAPILAWLWVDRGPVWAVLGLAVMALVLRWPLRYGLRWLRGRAGPRGGA
jgi:hypothetical protein